jgi:hypothetical protein
MNFNSGSSNNAYSIGANNNFSKVNDDPFAELIDGSS